LQAVLEVEDLAVGYGATQVLWGVSFTLASRERVGLFGPNGHGKSTLLKTISGLLKPWRGEIRYQGERIDGRSPRSIVDRGVIQVPQGNVLFPELTVAENLKLGAYCRRARPRERERLGEVLDLFPRLAERRRQPAKTLSGGERQMLSIGAGLMGAPALLMLDEPTLGLAPKLKDELLQAIDRISASGVQLILVEQDIEFLLGLTDHLYMINHGAVALDLAATDRLDHHEIMQMYFGKG
jgi:branched-chain amino acid transport system ATP-binding protein